MLPAEKLVSVSGFAVETEEVVNAVFRHRAG